MKAMLFHQHGDLENLVYAEIPDPQPRPGEVLVQVHACALNRLDILARLGETETPIPLPHIPGSDISGVIAKLGPEVEGFQGGERVVVNPRIFCGRCEFCLQGEQSMCLHYTVIGWQRHGGYAEYVAVPAQNVMEMPDGFPFEAAAAVPLAFTTAFRMLINRAEVREGENVLILGASGGVSSAAVQVAKLAGATVFATTTSSTKLQRIREIGADFVIDASKDAFDEVVLDHTGGRGVDVVFQTLAGDTWQRSVNCVRRGGRIVICATLCGANPPADLGTILWKQIKVIGSTGGTPLDFQKVMNSVWQGRVRPLVDRVFPLQQAREAQQYLMSQKQFGKVVLVP
ncbi:MAG: alcohol dehydrogenase catalytic domain-containing protein [Ardenticatenaceae bacterium]|nr:alcohol dehydrogenase catalytic domain-containing protein [Ardenticatenaceae bacterium]HBY92746.1 alcohol dehydrogenase [Chloroflexota bacterium]